MSGGPEKTNGTGQAKGVDAVDRALGILLCFGREDAGLSLAEIASRTGLYKSTILRLTVSLERQGFLRRGRDKTYRLGPELLRLGSIYRHSLQIEEQVRPALQRLLQMTGESASFFIAQDRKRICLYREESSQTIRDHVTEGEMLNLDQGAAGHVLIEYSKAAASLDVVETSSLPRFSFGERAPDVAAAAAPVFALDGAETVLLGALTISGPMTRFTQEQCERIRQPLLTEAKTLSTAFGAQAKWRQE